MLLSSTEESNQSKFSEKTKAKIKINEQGQDRTADTGDWCTKATHPRLWVVVGCFSLSSFLFFDSVPVDSYVPVTLSRRHRCCGRYRYFLEHRFLTLLSVPSVLAYISLVDVHLFFPSIAHTAAAYGCANLSVILHRLFPIPKKSNVCRLSPILLSDVFSSILPSIRQYRGLLFVCSRRTAHTRIHNELETSPFSHPEFIHRRRH